MRTNAARSGLLAIAAFLLTACASNQRERPDPEGISSTRTASVSDARAYAQAMRSSYQKMIDSDRTSERNLGTGLIGLGGVIAGLAGFGAHRDAVSGAALLGGTSYAIGNWNLSRQRQQVYLAGIEALNCADGAVAPFDMPAAQRKNLDDGLAALLSQISIVTNSVERTAALQSKVPTEAATEDMHAVVTQAIADARAVLATGREASASGQKISANVRLAGGALEATVKRIDWQVDKAVGETMPSLSTIRDVVGQLAALSGSFAPGSAVEARFIQGLKGSGGSPTPQSTFTRSSAAPNSPVGSLEQALLELEAATAVLRNAIASVRAATISFDSAATAVALAGCGVTIAFPLVVRPTDVSLKASEEFPVIVEGGTAGYKVHIQGSKPKGFDVTQPLGKDRAIYLKATAELKGPATISLLVTDSSEPFKTATITVNVPPAASDKTDGDSTKTTDPNALSTRIASVAPFKIGATEVSIEKPVGTANDRVQVTLACKTKPVSPISRAVARDELVKQMVAGSSIEADLKAAGVKAADEIEITGAADCIAPAPESTFIRIPKPSQPAPPPIPEDLALLQRKLCLPEPLVSGRWDAPTEVMLNAWRIKTRSATKSGRLSIIEEKSIRDAKPEVAAAWCKA